MNCTTAPIVILSFDRPDLLRKLLISVCAQSAPPDPAKIYLFQDGESAVTDECVSIFKELAPEGVAFISEKNLGVALNFDRAERWVFESLNAEVAYFLEDDLILGPHYFEVLNQLAELALSDDRIAYVAAYGNHRATLAEQRARAQEIVPMHHKWGFALTRRQWLRQKDIVDGYLNIVRSKPYRHRDHAAVRQYFNSLGYQVSGTSQDAAKDIASLVLGTVKLMTFACFARYEGKEGLHMRPDAYEKEGYGDTEIFPEPVSIKPPSEDDIDRFVMESRAISRIRADSSIEVISNQSLAHTEDSVPVRMTADEVNAFERRLKLTRHYLEFGCGGSTLLALRKSSGQVVSIESDASWVSKLKSNPEIQRGTKDKRLHIHHVDIGPVGAWGAPKDESRLKAWRDYYANPWTMHDFDYDFVLIDGRFRVMCALAAVMHLKSSAIVGIHDYSCRQSYYVIEKYFDTVEQVDSLVFFRRRNTINLKAWMGDFVENMFNFG